MRLRTICRPHLPPYANNSYQLGGTVCYGSSGLQLGVPLSRDPCCLESRGIRCQDLVRPFWGISTWSYSLGGAVYSEKHSVNSGSNHLLERNLRSLPLRGVRQPLVNMWITCV